jgi:NAD(P)-dependent dehydrogenase (short-subunit alcohol dehydrogenase family)
MADLEAVRAAGARAADLGPVGAVVHNAAVQVIGAVGEVSLADWQNTLAVNLLAADVLVGATSASLREHGGSVVVVSSVHAVATTRGMAAYATSKAALEGWVRAAALDLAPQVGVNAVRPGAVDTRMLRDGLVRRPEDGTEEAALAVLAAKVPLGRIIAPEDVARLVVALVDNRSPLPLTGACVTVDGGALLRLGTE